MANDFYVHGTVPQTSSNVRSFRFRNEFDLITLGFAKFPALTLANANKPLIVNSTGDGVTYTASTLSLAGNFATTGAFATTFAQQASTVQTLPPVTGGLSITAKNPLRGHIWGLTLSNNAGDLTNDIDFAAGSCLSIDTTDTNLVLMTLPSAITKQLDATWAVGTNQGGRATSLALDNRAWFVFLVYTTDGVVDAGFDSLSSGTNLLATVGISKVRRIGVIQRTASAIIPFVQSGNFFRFISTTNNTLAPGSTNEIGVAIGVFPVITTSNLPNKIVAVMKVVVRDTSPTPSYFRFRYGSVNNVASEAVANGVCATIGRGNSTQSWIPLGSPGGSGAMFHYRTNDATGINIFLTQTCWIDFREP